jgi:hypothetical protein
VDYIQEAPNSKALLPHVEAAASSHLYESSSFCLSFSTTVLELQFLFPQMKKIG